MLGFLLVKVTKVHQPPNFGRYGFLLVNVNECALATNYKYSFLLVKVNEDVSASNYKYGFLLVEVNEGATVFYFDRYSFLLVEVNESVIASYSDRYSFLLVEVEVEIELDVFPKDVGRSSTLQVLLLYISRSV